MAHNGLIRPGGWSLNSDVLPSEFGDIDQLLLKSINGDDGGTWAPTTPIIIGGAGFSAPFSSPPTYVTAQTKTRLVNCGDCLATGVVAKSTPSWTAEPLNNYGVPYPNGYLTNAVATGTIANGFAVSLDPYLENGSTITGATLTWSATAHSAVPTSQPFFGIFSVPQVSVDNLNTVVLARALLSTYWATNNAANLAAYNAASQSVVWTPNQNATIDRTAYTYFAVIGDECGSNVIAGNAFRSILLTTTSTNVVAP